MIPKIKNKFTVVFLICITFFLFTSCNNEEITNNSPEEDSVLGANSSLANLMLNTTANDGSADDIIDLASCLEIELPVTVQVNGIEIIIDSEEDYEQIEAILEAYSDDLDSITIQFPITIITSDYSEITIESEDALEELVASCDEDNSNEDIIECIDFQYPISISIYNSDFQVLETVTINNDIELYYFIEDLEGGLLASLNFPITMVLANGETLEVNSNQELEEAIENAEDTCDDIEDGWEGINCEEENIEAIENFLVSCNFTGTYYSPNEVQIDEHTFQFFQDGTIMVQGETAVIDMGTYTIIETNQGYALQIGGLETNTLANNIWYLDACEEYEIHFVNNNGIQLELEYDCEDEENCSQEYIAANLQECVWYIDNFNGTDTFSEYQLHFNSSNSILITTPNDTINANWELVNGNNNNPLLILYDLNNDLSGSWEILECEDELYLQSETGNLTMVLEQDCETDENPFECFSMYYELEECALDDTDTIFDAVFNLNEDILGIIDCEGNWQASFYTTQADAENQTNPIQNTEYYQSESTTIYLVITLANGEYEIATVQLFVEECNGTNACNEAAIQAYLQECIWKVVSYNGDDHLIDYTFNFDNTIVYITNQTDSTTVGWSTEPSQNNGTWLVINAINLPNIQAMSGDWLIEQCSESSIQMINANNTPVILQRDCN